MAVKYWYVASNGSATWATVANWYNGSGGTGGTTSVPTASDDVIVDSNSGTGNLIIQAAATCLSLTCTGFNGTLSGTSTLAIVNGLILASTMTLTYTGTITFSGTSAFIYSYNLYLSSITINVGATNTFYFNDNTYFNSNATLTLTSGTINFGSFTINLGLFVSTGAVARYITGAYGYVSLTGVGTVWNVSGTLFSIDSNSNYFSITDQSSTGKTITSTATTSATSSTPTGGTWQFTPTFVITGAGTGSYTLTGNFLNITFTNTGVSNVSFGTTTMYGILDFSSSYSNWNNGATTITYNTDGGQLILGLYMNITTSAALSITNPGVTDYVYIYNYGSKSLTAAITINGAGTLSGIYTQDIAVLVGATPSNWNGVFRTTGTLTLTKGLFYGMTTFIGLLSLNNTNTRTFSATDLYLTGIGAVIGTTATTGLIWGVSNIYLTDSSTSAKSIILTSVMYPATALYLGGSSSGPITYSPSSAPYFIVYVTNTGGAVINISTAATIALLDFGTSNCTWTNTTTITLVFLSIYLSPNMTITAMPTLLYNGLSQGEIRCYGKSLLNLTVNDTNLIGSTLYITGDLYVSGTLTFTSGTLYVYNAIYGATFSGMDRGFAGPTYSVGMTEDLYVGSITFAAGTGTRNYYGKDIYYTGTTATTLTSTTNVSFTCNNMYLSNSSGSARTITLNTLVYPQYSVYVAGTASGTTTVAAGTSGVFDVIVTNTGAAVLSLSTTTIKSLIFATGSNVIWTNAITQTITIQGNLTIYSAGTPTLTPALIFNGAYSQIVSGNPTSYITLGGKSLVTGAVTINDTAVSANAISFIFTDAVSLNAALTITSANIVTFNGAINGTTFTSTSCNLTTMNSTTTLSGAVSLANNASTANSLTLNGTASFASTLSHLGIGVITVNAPTTVSTSITLNNATSPPALVNNSTLTTPTFTITNGYLTSNATLNVSGTLTLSVGQITVNNYNIYNLGTFVSTGSGVRNITMNNSTWNINGTGVAASVWNLVSTNLTLNTNNSIINITENSGNLLTFVGAGFSYNTVQFARSSATGSTTITGNNTFTNFIDIGTATHSIIFTAGSSQTIGNFVVIGNPAGQIILNSTTTAAFTLIKSPAGLVNCDYLNIQHCIASPSTGTWYAGTNSVNNQAVSGAGSGWIFTNMPPRKMGSGGVG